MTAPHRNSAANLPPTSVDLVDTPRERIHIDPRVGGRYELAMVRRDGNGEFAISYEIVELVEPEPIVLRSDPMPEVGMHEPTITRVEFIDHGTHLEAMRDVLPHGQLAIVPGTTHALPLEKPALRADLILAFLADEQVTKLMPTRD